MDSPIIQRRDYGDYGNYDQNNVQNPTSTEENNKFIVIHITIIFSVLTFIVIVGVILCLYRRRLRKSKSITKNLNDRIINITHLTDSNDGILDYYSNDYSYDSNKSSSDNIIIYPQLEPLEPVQEVENESEFNPQSSPTHSLTKENRNYFIYGKSSGIIPRNSNENGTIKLNSDTNHDEATKLKSVDNDDAVKLKSDINNDEAIKAIKLKSNKNNDEITNVSNGSIKLLNSKKRTKVDFNLISAPVTSPSESIYNNEKANSLSRTAATRVIPPIPTFSSNNYTQPKEILRGPNMPGNYLIRHDSDADTDVSDSTITINTIINDNPIMGIVREGNQIITNEDMVLDMIPINEYDGGSNFKNSN